jgi:hypothetical protein
MHALVYLILEGLLSRRELGQRIVLPSAAAIAAAPLAQFPSHAAAPNSATLPYTSESVPGVTSSDRRQYAMVTLANGMRGLVCCDEAYARCELAVTVPCGSLDDPIGLEGLAHLAEHITLASDPTGINAFIDERQGDLNAFTGERTTSFYGTFGLLKTIKRGTSASTAESDAQAAYLDDIKQGCRKFAALFGPLVGDKSAVVAQEVLRVDAELVDIVERPSRALIEIAALKARAAPESAWSRLGRGGRSTLRAETPEQARTLSAQVASLREDRYRPEGVRFAVVTPLPLAQTVPQIAESFGSSFPPSMAPSMPPSSAASAARTPTARARTTSLETAPFPDLGRVSGGAMAIKRPGQRALLVLSWEVLIEDALAEARRKPLDLLGHTLTEPHAHSLAALLRARGLAPLALELEPVITAKTVARADGWQIWALEITLAEKAEGRWREAAALARAAVAQLARRGVPLSTAAEAQAMADAAWRWSSRPPTALDLASDLQVETEAAWSVRGPRAFVGTPAELSRAAQEAAEQLAGRSPIITIWAADPRLLGVQEGGFSPPLPWPLDGVATLVPLIPPLVTPLMASEEMLAASGSDGDSGGGGGGGGFDWQPPPRNPWVPTTTPNGFEMPSSLMVRVGYRVGASAEGDAQGASSSTSSGRRRSQGIGTLQLPGCVELRTIAMLPGRHAALADAMCLRSLAPAAQRPLAVAAVELLSSRPSAAGTRAAIQAELWRLTLVHALAEPSSAAARAGLKCDVSFNDRGMRLLVTGYAQKLPRLMILVLRKTLRHVPPPAASAELAAARRVALSALGRPDRPPRTLDNLADVARTTPVQMQRELSTFFGSITGASLLIAGALSIESADSLSAAVRTELRPLLPRMELPPIEAAASSLQLEPSVSFEDELEAWRGLLYKPLFFNTAAQNACLDPAIGRTLDQCGGI